MPHTVSLQAQNNFNYIPLKDNEAENKTLLKAVTNRYGQDVAALNQKNKKYIADIYKERYESIAKYFTDSSVITEEATEKYLQAMLAEIIHNNAPLKNLDLRVLFSREWWPNAFCSGEGTVIFNIGLFSRLQNESQVAFVLCHELSHQYLDHGNQHIYQYVNTVYSDEFQQKLKQIKNTEYGKRELYEQTVKGMSFNSRRHGREHEAQADSMALEFLKNTQYNISAASSCLALLDSVDNDKYNVLPKQDSFFNSSSYPFKAAWTKKETSFFNTLAASSELTQAEKDSLKTHPDCKRRVQHLQPAVQQYENGTGKNFIVTDSVAFKNLQQTFDFEIVNHNYQTGSISRSLYYSLQMLQTYRGNAFLITNIGRCFNKMYQAQKNHELGKIADAPSPANETKYNNFLQFLQQLRLQEIASVNYYFLTPYSAALSSNATFLKAYETGKSNFNNQ